MTDGQADRLLQVRVTGVLIEDSRRLLLVRQDVSPTRRWGLPGGKLRAGETLDEGVRREVLEETGLAARVVKLLYICDKPDATPPLIHVSFLLERVGGITRMPSNELDENLISDVRWVDTDQLVAYDFSQRFADIVTNGFPNAGSYVGPKEAIGL
jgi:ADP-ribose pyrophosphatase YjhB (NUDIX family)